MSNNSKALQQSGKINQYIQAHSVVVINQDGEKLDEMPTSKALLLAEAAEMDLVVVSPDNAKPVICKIMNYSKQKYEKQKNQHKFVGQKKMKELKMGIKIEKHDLEIKINHATQFLQDGHSVRIVIQLRGRDMQRKEEGFKIITRISESLSAVARIQEQPGMLGNVISAMFIPEKKK